MYAALGSTLFVEVLKEQKCDLIQEVAHMRVKFGILKPAASQFYFNYEDTSQRTYLMSSVLTSMVNFPSVVFPVGLGHKLPKLPHKSRQMF